MMGDGVIQGTVNRGLQFDNKSAMVDHVIVNRADLELEHRWLLARLHRLRDLLGYPPLETGKRQRRNHE